jgi:hypothetical protein
VGYGRVTDMLATPGHIAWWRLPFMSIRIRSSPLREELRVKLREELVKSRYMHETTFIARISSQRDKYAPARTTLPHYGRWMDNKFTDADEVCLPREFEGFPRAIKETSSVVMTSMLANIVKQRPGDGGGGGGGCCGQGGPAGVQIRDQGELGRQRRPHRRPRPRRRARSG